MIDKPFHVERSTRPHSIYADTSVTCFAIVRTGVGMVCTVNDVTWAYRICELLNEDELRAAGNLPRSLQLSQRS